MIRYRQIKLVFFLLGEMINFAPDEAPHPPMQLTEVKDKISARHFLRVPSIIYRSDPHWIPHLDKDTEAVFDPGVNQQYRRGDAVRWILRDRQGQLIGRVAAFVKDSQAAGQAVGGMGFFECIDNRDAAFMLFDACRQWLQERGMEAMDGPINFGDKERFWGLLVAGHGKPPPYLMNYHPPYYRRLFEAYGFRNYYEQYVYHSRTDVTLPPILEKKYQRLTESQAYRFECLRLSQLEQFAEDFRIIYNSAWSDAHKEFSPMTKQQALESFSSMKQVLDPDLLLFAYHHDRPVAFFIGIPELNELFRYVNGRLNLAGKLKFLYHRWRGRCRTIYGLIFGIIPEYQNRGLESALVMSLQRIVSEKNHYRFMYITWLGDFNPKMIRIVEHLGAERAFTLITWRKLFDEAAPFERHPVIQ